MQWLWGRREVDGFKLCQSCLGPRMVASFPVGCGSCWRQGDGLASCSLRFHVARAMSMGLTRACLAPLSSAHRRAPKEAGMRLLRQPLFTVVCKLSRQNIPIFLFTQAHHVLQSECVLFLSTYKSSCTHISHTWEKIVYLFCSHQGE